MYSKFGLEGELYINLGLSKQRCLITYLLTDIVALVVSAMMLTWRENAPDFSKPKKLLLELAPLHEKKNTSCSELLKSYYGSAKHVSQR